MFGGLSIQEITTVITGAVAVIGAILAAVRVVLKDLKELKQDLGHNTKLTENIQQAQINQAEYDYLKRWYAAFTTFPECEACKERIEANLRARALRATDSPLTRQIMQQFEDKRNG